MISLNPIPSNQPLNPGDNLIEHLAASARPAIIQYSEADRVELSGRVTINWATKMTHLIDSYGTVASDTLLVDLPVTWRSLALVLGAARSEERKSTRLNSSHVAISYAVFCLKKKNSHNEI